MVIILSYKKLLDYSTGDGHMKIAIFTDTFLPQINGVTNTLRRIGDYLEEQGMEYIFIAPDQKADQEFSYNVEKFFSAPLFLYPECRVSILNKLRLDKTLKDFKPDVIFCMTEFNMGLAGLLYGQKYKIPVVTNYSTNFSTIIKSYKLGIFEKALDKYLGWFHQKADMTVTPSVESQKELVRLGVKRSEIFGRGIDFDRFSPDHCSEDLRLEMGIHNKISLLYVGRLSPEKDLDLLRDSMLRLHQKYGDKVVLVVTGEGPMEAELRRTMPKNTIFTGYKKGHELAQIYASCDIFAFPSSFETFGNVVLESLASGTPVVCVNKGGVLESIKHGENGYIAEAFNVESFTECLENLIDREDLRHKFAQSGRSYAETRSWQAIIDGLMNIFDDAIITHGIIEHMAELISDRTA